MVLLDFERMHRASAAERVALLGLSHSAYPGETGSDGPFSTAQTQRLSGLSALIGQVQAMVRESGEPRGFDAARWLAQWCGRPNQALGGRAPAGWLNTLAGQAQMGRLLALMQGAAYA